MPWHGINPQVKHYQYHSLPNREVAWSDLKTGFRKLSAIHFQFGFPRAAAAGVDGNSNPPPLKLLYGAEDSLHKCLGARFHRPRTYFANGRSLWTNWLLFSRVGHLLIYKWAVISWRSASSLDLQVSRNFLEKRINEIFFLMTIFFICFKWELRFCRTEKQLNV